MIERLKELRKSLNLSQKNFGERIGLQPSSYCDIEHNRSRLTDRNLYLICERFGINEEWLKNGTGEIFSQANKLLIDELKNEIRLDDFQYDMINEILALNHEQQQEVIDYIHSLT